MMNDAICALVTGSAGSKVPSGADGGVGAVGDAEFVDGADDVVDVRGQVAADVTEVVVDTGHRYRRRCRR